MNEETVPVMFKWINVKPDPRAYKPSAPELEPVEIFVNVDVPLIDKYISNVEAFGVSENVMTVLTPTGMKYCIDQLESIYEDEKKETDTSFDTVEGWDDPKEKDTNSEEKDTDDWVDETDDFGGEDKEFEDTTDPTDDWADEEPTSNTSDEPVDFDDEDWK